jgi:hypothetical protein
MIKDSEEITHRDHFGYLCRRRGLVKEALEVGVDQAVFAKQFMSGAATAVTSTSLTLTCPTTRCPAPAPPT